MFHNIYQELLFSSCGDRPMPRLINHPLPSKHSQASIEQDILLKLAAMLFVLMPLCAIPGIFVPYHVNENRSKAKFLQLANGASISAFWISNYLWDLSLYTVLAGTILLVFVAFGETTSLFVGSPDSALCTFLLILGYGASSLPFSYILSTGSRCVCWFLYFTLTIWFPETPRGVKLWSFRLFLRLVSYHLS